MPGSSLGRRSSAASFPDQKTLGDFDWQFNTTISRKQIYELVTGKFVREHRSVLLVQPPDVDKSHIAQGLGRAPIQSRTRSTTGASSIRCEIC